MVQVAPSILAADFAKLGQEVTMIHESGADRIHFDVMDGQYVPEISFGPGVLSAIRGYSDLPMDVHLMVREPERHIAAFARAGADSITVHVETTSHLDRTLREIKAFGKQAGVSLNPATSLSTLDYVLSLADIVLIMSVNPGYGGQAYIPGMSDKIMLLKKRILAAFGAAKIHVDGGIGLSSAETVINAGADVLISGSAFFTSPDKKTFIKNMKMGGVL